MNASLAVLIPGDTETILVSVCSSEISPSTAKSILCSFYNSFFKASNFVILGDFDQLSTKKENCSHGVFNGESLTDCIPESFDSLKEYEDTILRFPYDNNYMFKDKAWWEVIVDGNEVKYKKLKKSKKRKRKYGKTK